MEDRTVIAPSFTKLRFMARQARSFGRELRASGLLQPGWRDRGNALFQKDNYE